MRLAGRSFQADADQSVQREIRVGDRVAHRGGARLQEWDAQGLAQLGGGCGLGAHLAVAGGEDGAALHAEAVQHAQRVERDATLHAGAGHPEMPEARRLER